MAASKILGKIEKVDLREVWSNEASDFTPWLARNLDLLGIELGMDLEIQTEEAEVGSFYLDLLARETGTSRQIVIENQLEDTDHDHLGKLLTYASGYDSQIVVWIARKFREEHRDALDWLNRRTGEETEFFGVAVELLKIGNSDPAPHFSVISAPNGWSKSTVSNNRRPASKKGERYRTFFQPLIDTLRDKHKFTNARKAQPQSWYNFGAGVSWATYSASFWNNGRAKVELSFDSASKERNELRFDLLKEQKDSIESALGSQLEWRRMNSNKACRIALHHPGSIEDDEETLEKTRAWMIDKLLAFKKVFGTRITELKVVAE